jgi:hypothetical protein
MREEGCPVPKLNPINITTRPALRRAGVSERNELSHEPLQYFPHSTPTFSCARRAREFLQGAPTFIYGSVDDDGSRLFIET